MNASHHNENLEDLRRALLADDNSLQADAAKADEIMRAACADVNLAAAMLDALPYASPSDEAEADANAQALWLMC